MKLAERLVQIDRMALKVACRHACKQGLPCQCGGLCRQKGTGSTLTQPLQMQPDYPQGSSALPRAASKRTR
jgi:hypothetical protein